MELDRRGFLAKAGIAAGLVASGPYLKGLEKSGKYRTALIGAGWWGMNIAREAIASGHNMITSICDVDDRQLNPSADQLKELSGTAPKKYRDYRELLKKENPEIVIVATPDHWHPLITIAATEVGAHVYVEKPIGHTIMEGRAMVNAARANNRVVTVGTHRRISPHNMSGMKFLKDGGAGKIGMVKAFVNNGGGPESPRANEEVPEGLDWDMWCGPAPLRPFNTKIHTRGFRHFLDYANGTLGDWGIHWLDQILWWAGDNQHPKRIFSSGGRHIMGEPVNDGISQTSDAPDHQIATYEFEDFTAYWEHKRFAGNNTDKGEHVGCYFYGTKGIFHMGWIGGWTFYPRNQKAQTIHQKAELHAPDSQNIRELWADFIESIKSGRRPVCDIEKVHYSTNMSLLGMLSLKLGQSLDWDGEKERVIGNKKANQLLTRKYRGEWKYPRS